MNKEKIKKEFTDVAKLLWSFKWYILAYLPIFVSLFHAYFYPLPENELSFKYRTDSCWKYTNQEFYIESVKIGIIQYALGFLLAISNMRNHPRIAKLIFLSPWLIGLFNLISIILRFDIH